jgi:hypothetical protein
MIMQNAQLPINSQLNNTRSRISQYRTEHDPEVQLKEASKIIDKILDPDSADLALSDHFKAITINGFNNGVLMCDAILDQFRTFAIEMMRQLQQEYNCQTASEKSLCEMATIAYVRIFEYQQLMLESEKYQSNLAAGHTCGEQGTWAHSINSVNRKNMLGCCACNRAKIEQQHYQTLGKELDRANRHYLTAIQTLRMMKQVPIQITVKAQTAIVGQNQVVQTNNSHE